MAGDHRNEDGPFIPRRIMLGVFLIVVGLLVAAVVIGLLRDQVNVDGLIIALMPVVTGVLLGGAIRTRPKDGDR